jgi:hypothetical protein
MLIASFFVLIAQQGCKISSTDTEDLPLPAIYLEDLDGNQYDIAHAIAHYDFEVNQFSQSAGPLARPPIIEPEMIEPGDRSYPPETATTKIIGATIGGDSRAYAIRDISRNEVVDETVGEAHVTIAY